MHLYLALFLSFSAYVWAECSDNCARAVAGILQYTSVASSDCSNFLQTTITPPASTISITVTSTVNATTTLQPARRQQSGTIPGYASVCKSAETYSSACSCLGVTRHAIITASVPVVTITVSAITTDIETITIPTTTPIPSYTNSASPASPTVSISPNCTASITTDPLNCGSCGNICSSGVCENGVCTNDKCEAQTCGDFKSCNGSSACFCFSSTQNGPHNGFCGQNAVCSGLTPCANDFDCSGRNSTGNICAIKTCCSAPSNAQPGVCLQGTCGNPATTLQMAAMGRRSRAGTAAYRHF